MEVCTNGAHVKIATSEKTANLVGFESPKNSDKCEMSLTCPARSEQERKSQTLWCENLVYKTLCYISLNKLVSYQLLPWPLKQLPPPPLQLLHHLLLLLALNGNMMCSSVFAVLTPA